MPSGFWSPGWSYSAKSTGITMTTRTVSAIAASAIRSTIRQRGEGSSPSGNRSSSTVPINTTGGAHSGAEIARAIDPAGGPARDRDVRVETRGPFRTPSRPRSPSGSTRSGSGVPAAGRDGRDAEGRLDQQEPDVARDPAEPASPRSGVTSRTAARTMVVARIDDATRARRAATRSSGCSTTTASSFTRPPPAPAPRG